MVDSKKNYKFDLGVKGLSVKKTSTTENKCDVYAKCISKENYSNLIDVFADFLVVLVSDHFFELH